MVKNFLPLPEKKSLLGLMGDPTDTYSLRVLRGELRSDIQGKILEVTGRIDYDHHVYRKQREWVHR